MALNYSGLEALAAHGNRHAQHLLDELGQADDDNERLAAVKRWMEAARPVVHAAADLAQTLGLTSAAANARAAR